MTYRHNRVVLLPDGDRFFHALYAAVRSAKHSLLVEFYLIRDDRTGGKLAEELIAAAASGVTVYLIYDYIGSIETSASFFRKLVSAGIVVTPFNPISLRRGISWFDMRDHRKMLLVDGELAFLGGFNIGDEYSGELRGEKRFHDAGFTVAGSAVSELVKFFSETYRLETGREITLPLSSGSGNRKQGQAGISFIYGHPLRGGFSIRNAFRFNIASASEELLIANPYFVPGPLIIRALLRAARRGVRIRLLMPARSDVPLVRMVGRSFYGVLLRGGIEIYEMGHEILHAKIMLVDGERTFIGSANLDQRSFHRNFEINAVVDSSAFARQVRRMLEADFEKAEPIHLDRHESRGIIVKVLEKLISAFSWFL